MLKRKSEPIGDQSEILNQAPEWFQNQMYAEAVANTQAMNQIRLAIVAKTVETILNPTPGSEIDPNVMMALIEKLGTGISPDQAK